MTLTAAQIAKRTDMIGASEIAAVVGMHPYLTALDLYAAKVLPNRDDSGNRFTRWGQRLEAVVATAYSEETGIELVVDQETRVHPIHACIGATPDYRSADGSRLVEIKTGDARTAGRWGEPGTDEVPDHVGLQVIQQMAVCDVDQADVAVLLGGNDLRIYHLTRHRETEALLLAQGVAFWTNHVLAKSAPEPVDGESAQRFAARLFPRSLSDTILPASAEQADTIASLLRVRDQIADLENEKDLLEAELKGAIGDGAGLSCAEGAVTWKSTKSNGTDYKGLVESLGVTKEQLARWARPGVRKFLVSPSKMPGVK
jgi:putative phage-type endonuclease